MKVTIASTISSTPSGHYKLFQRRRLLINILLKSENIQLPSSEQIKQFSRNFGQKATYVEARFIKQWNVEYQSQKRRI